MCVSNDMREIYHIYASKQNAKGWGCFDGSVGAMLIYNFNLLRS